MSKRKLTPKQKRALYLALGLVLAVGIVILVRRAKARAAGGLALPQPAPQKPALPVPSSGIPASQGGGASSTAVLGQGGTGAPYIEVFTNGGYGTQGPAASVTGTSEGYGGAA